MQTKFLLFCVITFIVHTFIFCPRISQKHSANQPQNTGESFTTKLTSKCNNSGTFKGKKSHLKKSLMSFLDQAIQLHPVKTQMIPQTFLEAHMVQALSVDVPWVLNRENEREYKDTFLL